MTIVIESCGYRKVRVRNQCCDQNNKMVTVSFAWLYIVGQGDCGISHLNVRQKKILLARSQIEEKHLLKLQQLLCLLLISIMLAHIELSVLELRRQLFIY